MKKLSSRLLSYAKSESSNESLREMLLSQHLNLLALIGTLTFKTPKPFLYLYYSILCIEILEWRCCCATDCGTFNVRISMFLKKTVSGVSKFLYFRPILRMSATDRQPLYSNRSQSVARTHSFSFICQQQSEFFQYIFFTFIYPV